MLAESAIGLPAFITYFFSAVLLLGLFLAIYVRVTPYREISLIREGNNAAAISLAGTVIGLAVPLSSALEESAHLVDFALWGGVACSVQLGAYLVARLTLPHLARDIPAGKTAPAIFLAALSIAVGLLNAASMTY